MKRSLLACPQVAIAVASLVLLGCTSGVLAATAPASTPLPLSPTNLYSGHAHNGLQVEPKLIIYTGDGTGLLAGANVGKGHSSIDWTKWTSTIAVGTGFNQLNDCEPSCAGGTYTGYAVKIEMWRPETLAGTLVFTRMTILYAKRRPHGEPRHYTFTDTYLPGVEGAEGGYGWGPPDFEGYCAHTHGTKPAAGCQNIHSLP